VLVQRKNFSHQNESALSELMFFAALHFQVLKKPNPKYNTLLAVIYHYTLLAVELT